MMALKRLKQLSVSLGDRSYPICIGDDLLPKVNGVFQPKKKYCAVIVTNETVAPLYLESFRTSLLTLFNNVQTIVLADGEQYKTMETLNDVFTSLLSQGADRGAVLFALGGGVIGDLTGFAASCYMRGISYVQVPTTLLAQVDSSVGGKTAVNHPLGKNMIGAFYHPQCVIADISTLKTLPLRELKAGLAEVVKYGFIYDIDFLAWLESNLDAIFRLEGDVLTHLIYRSCEIKAEIVAQDETEQGIRALLNFGHTFGHAIEAGLGYGHWLHGEGVGCGMLMAAALSMECGYLGWLDYERVKRLIERIGLPTIAPALDAEQYLKLMQNDKKTLDGELRFILLERLGKGIVQSVPPDLVKKIILMHQQK